MLPLKTLQRISMKTLALLIALTSLSAFASIGPQGRSTAILYDGSADANSLEKEFINVINNEGSSIAAGSAVILDVTVDDGASVIVDTTASMTPICIMVAACADNALCKCQTYGLGSALTDLSGGNAVAGAPFFLSQLSAGYVRTNTLGGVEIPAGVFYDAASATGSVEVFIKLK